MEDVIKLSQYFKVNKPNLVKYILDETSDIKPEYDIVLAGGLGEDCPEFTKSKIWFNGLGPKLDHETLGIVRVLKFAKDSYKAKEWEQEMSLTYKKLLIAPISIAEKETVSPKKHKTKARISFTEFCQRCSPSGVALQDELRKYFKNRIYFAKYCPG